MVCAAFGEAAAELALGILTGPDRSAALDHMDRCPRCQAEVVSLAAAADRLLDLIPARGAPAGFESRVAAAFRQPAPARAARRRAGTARRRLAGRRWRAGSAAAAAAAAALLGLGLHQIATPPGQPAYGGAAVAALRTPAGVRAGEVVVTGPPQPWLVMIVNPGSAPGRYHCYLRTSSGRQESAGVFQVHPDGGIWVTRLPMPQRDLTGARLAGPGGTEIASATFGKTPDIPPDAGAAGS
jgi:hypothetical protein